MRESNICGTGGEFGMSGTFKKIKILKNLNVRRVVVKMGDKWKVKVKVILEQATKALRSSRCIGLLFILGPIWGLVVNATLRLLYPQESDLVPILKEDGWAFGWINLKRSLYFETNMTIFPYFNHCIEVSSWKIFEYSEQYCL
jgi:hypothetical protein